MTSLIDHGNPAERTSSALTMSGPQRIALSGPTDCTSKNVKSRDVRPRCSRPPAGNFPSIFLNVSAIFREPKKILNTPRKTAFPPRGIARTISSTIIDTINRAANSAELPRHQRQTPLYL
jgi:hypothetical protein